MCSKKTHYENTWFFQWNIFLSYFWFKLCVLCTVLFCSLKKACLESALPLYFILHNYITYVCLFLQIEGSYNTNTLDCEAGLKFYYAAKELELQRHSEACIYRNCRWSLAFLSVQDNGSKCTRVESVVFSLDASQAFLSSMDVGLP